MKNSKDLSLDIQAKQAEVEAITALATQENRELTSEESASVDASKLSSNTPRSNTINEEMRQAKKSHAVSLPAREWQAVNMTSGGFI